MPKIQFVYTMNYDLKRAVNNISETPSFLKINPMFEQLIQESIPRHTVKFYQVAFVPALNRTLRELLFCSAFIV